MVPIYSLVSFLSYVYYRHAIYFETLRDCYEAFAIASFFALMCHYLAPDLHSQKDFFRTLNPRPWVFAGLLTKCFKERRSWRTPRSGLTWFNVRFASLLLGDESLTRIRLFGLVFSNTASSAFSLRLLLSLRKLLGCIVRSPQIRHLPISGYVSTHSALLEYDGLICLGGGV